LPLFGNSNDLEIEVLWVVGGLRCSGYYMDAIQFVSALEMRIPLSIILDFGLCTHLSIEIGDELKRLQERKFTSPTVTI